MFHSGLVRLLIPQILGVCLCLTGSIPAQDKPPDLSLAESNLNLAFRGKILILRNFYEGSMLEFGADGTLLRGGKPGYWTTDAKVEIKGFKVRRNDVEIEGRRIWFRYDQAAKRFQAIVGSAVKIKMKISANTSSLEHFQSVVGRVFHREEEQLSDLVPDYWQSFFARDSGQVKVPPPNATDATPKPLLPTGDVSPPVAKYKPEPPYTPAAREAKLEGTVALLVVVNTDGIVSAASIAKPIGLGLDDQAVATIKTWKFKPGTKNGQPVNFRVLIEIEFRMFMKN